MTVYCIDLDESSFESFEDMFVTPIVTTIAFKELFFCDENEKKNGFGGTADGEVAAQALLRKSWMWDDNTNIYRPKESNIGISFHDVSFDVKNALNTYNTWNETERKNTLLKRYGKPIKVTEKPKILELFSNKDGRNKVENSVFLWFLAHCRMIVFWKFSEFGRYCIVSSKMTSDELTMSIRNVIVESGQTFSVADSLTDIPFYDRF